MKQRVLTIIHYSDESYNANKVMNCTVNDINLSFDRDNRIRTTIGRVAGWDMEKATVLAAQLKSDAFKKYLSGILTSDDILNDAEVDISNIKEEDYANIKQNKFGSLLNFYYLEHYHSVDSSKTNKGLGRLLGFSTSNAKRVAKEYVADEIISRYQQNLNRPRENRKTNDIIIREVRELINKELIKRATDFANNVVSTGKYSKEAVAYAQKYLDLINKGKELARTINAEISRLSSLRAELNTYENRELTPTEQEQYNNLKVPFEEANKKQEERRDAMAKIIRDRRIMAANLINLFSSNVDGELNERNRNYLNLYMQINTNANEFFFEVFHTKKMTNLIKEYNRIGDIEDYIEEEDTNNDIVEDKFNNQSVDETSKTWEDSLYKNFNQAISTKMKFILSRVQKLSSPYNNTDNIQAIDTNNELGVPLHYDPSYLTVQILSAGDFSNVDSMIRSLEYKSRNVKALYGLGSLVNQLKQDRNLANYFYSNFAKPLVNKVMCTINEVSAKDGIVFDYSNPNAFDRVKLAFDLMNKLRATYNTQYNATDAQRLDDILRKINDDNIDSFREEFANIITTYFPNFDATSFDNIFRLPNKTEVVKSLIRNMSSIIKGVGRLKQRINDQYEEINKEWNEAKEEYRKTCEKLIDNSATQDQFPEPPVKREFNPNDRNLTADINQSIIRFANTISEYNESRARMNTANAEGNTASDVIKNCFVTRFFDMILAEDGNNSVAGLMALGEYLTQGMKQGQENQYANNPIFFGLKDHHGNTIKGCEGMFTLRPNGGFEINGAAEDGYSYAKNLLKYALFDGIKNNNRGEGTVYDKMSKIEFFITQYIAFNNSVSSRADENNTTKVGNMETAVYPMRIGSDAPKIFMIRAPKYSRRQVEYALYNHFLDEMNMFVQAINNLFVVENRKFVTKTSVDGLISRAYFDEGTAEEIRAAIRRGEHDDNYTNAIIKDGKLVGKMFKFNRLFELKGYNFGEQIERILSLYGGVREGVPALFVPIADGRLSLNAEYLKRDNSFLVIDGEKVRLNLNTAQQDVLFGMVKTWTNTYIQEAKEEIADYIEALQDQGVPYTDTTIESFLLNTTVMNMNYDDMFEGDFKYYNKARDFLKRTKETQAGGESYENSSSIDATNKIENVMFNGNPAVIKVKSTRGGEQGPYKVPTYNGTGIEPEAEMVARTGWRAVTIYNTVKPADEAAELQEFLEKQFIKEGMKQEDAHARSVKIAKGYWDTTTVNDAQSYITIEEFIRRKDAEGTLDEYQDLLAQLLDPNVTAAKIDLDAINARIQVQKNFYYDKVFDPDTNQFIPRQIKNAEFVLIPKLLPADSELKKVYDWMRANDIGQLNTAETDKAAKKNIFTIWTEDTADFIDPNTNAEFNETYVQNYKYKYLYKQQDVPQHMINEENKLGSQISKKIIDNISTAPEKIQRYAKEYQDAYVTNIKEDFNNFLDAMGWEISEDGKVVNINYATTDADGNPLPEETIKSNRETLNLTNYYARARQEAVRLGMDSNFMEYLIPDEFGKPVMPNVMNSVQQKLESVGQALFNRAITRQTLPGWHAAQITGVGYSSKLEFNPETGVMQVYLPRWSNLIPKGSTPEEDAEILKQIEEQGLDIHLGYRIPTEGKQSISVLKVVGFTNDALGSTIVIPDAWVTQTGSDFDVDSIYGIAWEMYARKGKDGKVRLYKVPFEEDKTDDRMLYISHVNHRLDAKVPRNDLGQELDSTLKETRDILKATNREAHKQYKKFSKDFDEQDAIRNKLYKEKLPGWARGIIKDINKQYTVVTDGVKKTDIEQAYPSIAQRFDEYLKKHNVSDEVADIIHQYVDQQTTILNIIDAQRGIYSYDKDQYHTEMSEAAKAAIENNINNWVEVVEQEAGKVGIMSFEEFKALPYIERLSRKARNNYILHRMIEIMNDDSSREEQYGRSQFEGIVNGKDGANDVVDKISGTTSKLISPYNPLTQLDYFDDAMSGAGLKARSVNWDTMASKSNWAHGYLSDEDAIYTVLDVEGPSAKDSAITYDKNTIENAYEEDIDTYDDNVRVYDAPEKAFEDNKPLETNTDSNTQEDINQIGKDNILRTIDTLNSDNNELSPEEKKIVTEKLGRRPRVLVASQATDPVFHAKQIKRMVEEELAKPADQRKFHMMYLITKHDGLPFKELANLKIPKFIHFSITSLGGTKYEPGVMRADDLLDRIEKFIQDGTIDPKLVTVRIDPIIPGVTKKEDIRHIMERAKTMGIRQFKFSLMDSYGNYDDRFIVPKMRELGYSWETYYNIITNKDNKQIVDFNPKQEYINDFYSYMDNLAEELDVHVWTCGENPKGMKLKKVRTNVGCINVDAMNKAMGTTDISYVRGQQRPDCTCYGNKQDACSYGSTCASSCVYCYAKHNGNAVMTYYDKDGKLLDNNFTRTVKSELPEEKLYKVKGVGDAIHDYTLHTGTQYNGEFTEGGDKLFFQVAQEIGIKTTSYSPRNLEKLNAEELQEVEEAYIKACEDLGRPIKPNTLKGGGMLTRRDYLQAKYGDAVFAIGNILYPGQINAKGYTVQSKGPSIDGGTGYAVQMAINMNKPVHVYSTTRHMWFTYDYSKKDFVVEDTPVLTPNFTGIGTRDIKGDSHYKDVITNLFVSARDGFTRKSINTDDLFTTRNNKQRVLYKANKYGWSNNNKNIVNDYVTTYTSQTTAHHLDAVKRGSIPNVNAYTFDVYKLITCVGLDHEFSVGFMRQPIISRLVANYNLTNSIFFGDSRNPINMTFAEIAKDLGETTESGYGKNKRRILVDKHTDLETIIDSLTSDQNFVDAFKKIYGINVSKLTFNELLNIKFPLRKDFIFERIRQAGKSGNNRINREDVTAYNQAVIDFTMLVAFRQMLNTTKKINNIIQLSSVDKVGAKPSNRETRRIQELIEQYRVDDSFMVGDKNWVQSIFPLDEKGNVDVSASANKPIAAAYAYSTLPSIQVAAQVFITESPDYIEAENHAQKVIGRRFNEKESREWRQYGMTYLYNSISKLLMPLMVDERGRVLPYISSELQAEVEQKRATSLWDEERSRIVGYGVTDEGNVTIKDINNPTADELDKYSKLTPAQKVIFIQRHFPDNQGIFNYIKISLINNNDIKNKGITRQYLTYDDQVDSIEDLFHFFRNSFSNHNPLIKLAAIDLVKYAFIAEGFNFRSGYITKTVPNDVLYTDINQGGMDIINNVDADTPENNGIAAKLLELPQHQMEQEYLDLFVRSHSEMIKVTRLPKLTYRFNEEIGEDVPTMNISQMFKLCKRIDGIVLLDNTTENPILRKLIRRIQPDRNINGYIRIDFPIDAVHRETVLYTVIGGNKLQNPKYNITIDEEGNEIETEATAEEIKARKKDIEKYNSLRAIMDEIYKDYYLVPLNLLEKYETYDVSYNTFYNKFNTFDYYLDATSYIEKITEARRTKNSNAIVSDTNTIYPGERKQIGKFVSSTGGVQEAMEVPTALMALANSADSYIAGGAKKLIEPIQKIMVPAVLGGNYDGMYILDNNEIIAKYIPEGTFTEQIIFDSNGNSQKFTIAQIKKGSNVRHTIKDFIDGKRALITTENNFSYEYGNVVKSCINTATSPIIAKIYRVTPVKRTEKEQEETIMQAATVTIDADDADTINRDDVVGNSARRGMDIDNVSAAIIKQITFDSRKNDSAIADEFVRYLDRRGINKNFRSNLMENRANIYAAAARYYQSAANAIINKINKYHLLGTDYDMGGEELYEALAQNPEYFPEVANLILDAVTFGNRIDMVFSLDIATEEKETKDAIESIRRSINSIRTNTKVRAAMSNLINIYFKKYSTNPMITKGLMQIRDQFGDIDTAVKLISDPAEINNTEVQVILKQVYSMFSKAEMFETSKNLAEWRERIKEIDAMPGNLDMNNVIDFDEFRLRQDYNKKFIEDKAKVIEDYKEAKKHRFDSVDAYYNYLQKQFDRDEFMYKYTEQPILADYYKEDLDNRREVMQAAGKIYAEYRMLSASLYEINKSGDATDEETTNRARNIQTRMSRLKDINDVDGSEKAPHLKQAAIAIGDYITRRREITEKYFDKHEYDGFQETYQRYKSLIESYDKRHKEETLATKLENAEYREAYEWIRDNGHLRYTKEAEEKLSKAYQVLINRNNAISAKTKIRLKNIPGAIDDSGTINPMALTDEQIAILKEEEEGELSVNYANGDGEMILIKEVPKNIPLRFRQKKTIKYKHNAQTPQVIGRINWIISKAVNHDTGHIDIPTLFNNDYVTDAEREELIRLYTYLRANGVGFREDRGLDYTLEYNWTAYNKALDYYQKNLVNTKQGKQFLKIMTSINEDGRMIPNLYIYGYKVPMEDVVDQKRTDAFRFIQDNIEYVPTEYYYEAMDKASKEGKFNEWFEANHIYNPFTHKYEPLKIWTRSQAKPNSELAKSVEYIPSFDNMEQSVKKEYINNAENRKRIGLTGEGYKEFGSNYKRGDSKYDSAVKHNSKEQAMCDLISQTLNKYATTYQGKRFVGQGYLPRERETQVNGKWAVSQIAAMFGASWHSGADSDSFHEIVDYTHDREAEMNMLQLLKGKGSKQYKHLPNRADFKDDEEYEKELAKVREENRQISEENKAIDKNLVNKDFRKVMEDFVYNATIFNSRQAAKPYLYLLLEDLATNNAYMIKGLWNKKLVRDYDTSTRDDAQYRREQQTNTRVLIHNLARRLLFSQYHDTGAMRTVANFLQNLTSAKYMVFNLYGGIANVTTGKTNIMMEEFANEYFGFKEFARAEKRYLSNSLRFINSAFTDKASNLTVALCKKFKVVDFDQVLQFGATSENLDAQMKKIRNFLYTFQSSGEHFMQNSVLLAMLSSNRVYTDNDGRLRIGDFKDFSMDVEYQAMCDVLAQDQELLTNYKMYIDSIRKYDIEKRLDISMGRKDINRDFLYSLRDSADERVNALYKKTADAYQKRRKELLDTAKEEFNTNPTVESFFEFNGQEAVIKESSIANLKSNSKDIRAELEHLFGEFREKVKAVNKKIHGVYDKDGAALIESKWWGSLVMQYHKHLPTGIWKRWRRKGYYSEFRGSMERGTYQTFIDFIGTEFTNFNKRRKKLENDGTNVALASLQVAMQSAINTFVNMQFNWGNLSNWEKANIRRNLAEVAGILAACLVVIALYGLSDDDDINDDRFKASCLYLADRLYSETTMYGPVGLVSEFRTNWSNPIAAMGGINDLFKAMVMIPQYLFDPEFELEYQNGRYSGENKFDVLLKRNTVGFRNFDRILTIDKNNSYYKVGKSQIGINIAENFGNIIAGRSNN